MLRKVSKDIRKYWQEKVVPLFSDMFRAKERTRRQRLAFFLVPLVLITAALWWLIRQPRVQTALKENVDDWDWNPEPTTSGPGTVEQVQEKEAYSGEPLWASGVTSSEAVSTTSEAVATTEETQEETPQADNLTDIEGISPITAGVLWDAGIHTFEKLAETDVARLKEILRDADISDVDPGKWPEQARLLMRRDQEELAASSEEREAGHPEM